MWWATRANKYHKFSPVDPPTWGTIMGMYPIMGAIMAWAPKAAGAAASPCWAAPVAATAAAYAAW